MYCGDAVRDQLGYPATFKELHFLPTNVQAVSLTLFLGLLLGWSVQAADSALLQAPMDLDVPTWVILPKEVWPNQWHGRFKRVAVRLCKALYGHAQAPAL